MAQRLPAIQDPSPENPLSGIDPSDMNFSKLVQMHQEVVQQVSRGFSTSKTSENLVKPWKPQDLETYVSFSGNLLEIFYVEISENL